MNVNTSGGGCRSAPVREGLCRKHSLTMVIDRPTIVLSIEDLGSPTVVQPIDFTDAYRIDYINVTRIIFPNEDLEPPTDAVSTEDFDP